MRAVRHGLRAVFDFEVELPMALRNRKVKDSGSKPVALAGLIAIAGLGSLGLANNPTSSSFPSPRSRIQN